jgi:ribose transport system substrate-binding protein
MLSKHARTVLIAFILASLLATPALATGKFFDSEIKGKAIKPDGAPLKVGISVAELASEFIISLLEYSRWMLQQAGAEVTVVNANYSTHSQMSQLDDFIQKKVDVIIVQPTDSEALAPAVRRVNEAGIPIITVNRSVYGKGIKIDLFAGADDAVMGERAANFLLSKVSGSGAKVATIQGVLATANARGRAEGFSRVIKNSPKATVVSDRPADWKPELAMAAVTDVLASTPTLFGFFSHSDCMLPGVVSGLKQANRLVPAGDKKHVWIVSVDGAPYALDQIRKGTVDATIEQSPLMLAVVAVKGTLTRVAKGLPLGERTVLIDPVLITKGNVDDPSLWGNFDAAKKQLWPRTEEVWAKYLKY